MHYYWAGIFHLSVFVIYDVFYEFHSFLCISKLQKKTPVLSLLSYSTAYKLILLVDLEAAVGAGEMARPAHRSESNSKHPCKISGVVRAPAYNSSAVRSGDKSFTGTHWHPV